MVCDMLRSDIQVEVPLVVNKGAKVHYQSQHSVVLIEAGFHLVNSFVLHEGLEAPSEMRELYYNW